MPFYLVLRYKSGVNFNTEQLLVLMMKLARVLRTVLTPEPEKVNPLVLSVQKGDNLLGLPTV